MTIEQKFLLTTVILACVILILFVMCYAKRQEVKSLKGDYDKLRGDYNHLESSANLVGRIKQSEGIFTTFTSEVKIGDDIFTKEYSKNGEILSGKVVTVCWFGEDTYTFLVSFKEEDMTIEFPMSALGEIAFFTKDGAKSSKQKHTYSDFEKDEKAEEDV